MHGLYRSSIEANQMRHTSEHSTSNSPLGQPRNHTGQLIMSTQKTKQLKTRPEQQPLLPLASTKHQAMPPTPFGSISLRPFPHAMPHNLQSSGYGWKDLEYDALEVDLAIEDIRPKKRARRMFWLVCTICLGLTVIAGACFVLIGDYGHWARGSWGENRDGCTKGLGSGH